jgi:methionine aminotransferase
VYEHITFDEVQHESVLKYPNLFARSFVVFSFGKTFHATGWKIGYCIAPPHLSHEFRKIHQYLSFSVNAPMQYGLAKFLEDENNYLQISAFYEKKRNLFLQHFESLPFTMKEITKGSYFQLASYEKMSDLPDKDFAVWITKNYGVAVIPISAFYQNGKDDKLVRLCFCKKDETIIEAAKRLSAIPIS